MEHIESSQNIRAEKPSRHVVQSYIVTTAMYDFNVYEKRVLYNLVKLAQSQLEGLRLSENMYRIEHSMAGVVLIELPLSYFLTGKDDKNHARVKEALKSLHRKTFTCDDGNTWECFSIIAYPKINLGSSKVSFIVDAKVWDVLLNFSKGFSRYDIDVAFSLESQYSMRFYEMMASQEEPINYSIDFLRREFQLQDKYSLTKDFLRKVVSSSKDELDRKSPVSFNFVPIKTGKKITAIRFFPFKNIAVRTPELFFRDTVRKYGTAGVLSKDEKRLLSEIGFTASGIVNNIQLFLECQKHMDLLYELTLIKGLSREKKNPCGWCIRRLKCRLDECFPENTHGF